MNLMPQIKSAIKSVKAQAVGNQSNDALLSTLRTAAK
uniref:RpsT n=1 Tax=Lactobacillus delbrueckii TaxID=1584 RepID=Q6UE17_9LACO|nr:RpsT [Lactobacillus delbrueckii]